MLQDTEQGTRLNTSNKPRSLKIWKHIHSAFEFMSQYTRPGGLTIRQVRCSQDHFSRPLLISDSFGIFYLCIAEYFA